MATNYFGNSEEETERRVFEILDKAPGIQRVPQVELVGHVEHMISGKSIRPDGLLLFPDDETFGCLRGRAFALEIKPDVVARDHLKVISELTEQARSYVDSWYDVPVLETRREVDGCIVYPDVDRILSTMRPNQPGAKHSRSDDYKTGVRDTHRRSLARQRIYELVLTQNGFEILCCDEWLCRYRDGHWQVSGKNHQFRRKIGSDYR